MFKRQVYPPPVEVIKGHALLQLELRPPGKVQRHGLLLFNHADSAHFRVGQAGLPPFLYLLQRDDGHYYHRQLAVEAICQQLVKLFPGPRRAGLNAEIVQNQQRRISHLVEEFIVGNLTVGAEGRAQMVEKVGGGDIESGETMINALVGDGCRQVRFATAAGASKDEPPFRVSSKRLCRFVGPLELRLILRVPASPLRL